MSITGKSPDTGGGGGEAWRGQTDWWLPGAGGQAWAVTANRLLPELMKMF